MGPGAPQREIENLTADHRTPGMQICLRPPHRRWADDSLDAKLMHRPDIGAIVDEGRRDLVIGSMARQKRHAATANLGQRDRSAGWAIGSFDLDLIGRVEPLVESGPAENTDLRR